MTFEIPVRVKMGLLVRWVSAAGLTLVFFAGAVAQAGCEHLAGSYAKCNVPAGVFKMEIAFTRAAVEIRKVCNDAESLQVFRSYGDWTASTRIGVSDQLNCINDALIISSSDRGSFDPRRSEEVTAVDGGIRIRTFFGNQLYEEIRCERTVKRSGKVSNKP
jgi:hypothetical protein